MTQELDELIRNFMVDTGLTYEDTYSILKSVENNLDSY